MLQQVQRNERFYLLNLNYTPINPHFVVTSELMTEFGLLKAECESRRKRLKQNPPSLKYIFKYLAQEIEKVIDRFLIRC